LETLLLLSKIFGISFTSGINLYATVALIGMAIRFNFIQNLPEQLNVLANEYVIGVAVVMYVCEFFADKIPAFDSVWDSIHTFIRPFAAAAIALMAAGDASMAVKIIAVMLAGGVALTSHTAKAGIRLIANTSPEPFSNSVLSTIEDLGVFALIVLIITNPLLAAIIIAVLMILIIWQGPKLVGFVIFMMKAIYHKIRSINPGEKMINIELMPQLYNNYLDQLLEKSEQVYLTINTTFRDKKKGAGYLVVSADRMIILYKSWFKVRHYEIYLAEIKRMSFRTGILTDKIVFGYDKNHCVLTLFKDNSRSLDDIKNIFKSLDVEIVDPGCKIPLSGAETA
jgi:hypothetical protein